jgi:hypothetical protein
MQYRKFGSLDYMASILGFGAMRFHFLDGNMDRIDEPLAIDLMRTAVDAGVNYIDTAYVYHGGNSETVVGKALQDGYRQKVKIATKLPVWAVKEPGDMDRILNEQQKRLDDDHIDFYLLHGLNRRSWPAIREKGVLDWVQARIKEGRIGHLGFSFHDEPEVFHEILGAWDWTFCQVQYNFVDEGKQAGASEIRAAADKGLAVIVMEPLRGGLLSTPPQSVSEIYRQGGRSWSPSSWALRWVYNHPGVTLALSGMATREQLEDNLVTTSQARPGDLTAADLQTIEKAKRIYEESKSIGCTGCKYCLPCPQGVDIPRNFEIYNEGDRYNNFTLSWYMYWEWLAAKPEQRAEACTQCGLCEGKCPQKLPIRELLAKVQESVKAWPGK